MTTLPTLTSSRIPSLVRPFFEFLFPPVCFACNGARGPGEDIVCRRCWETVQPADRDDAVYRETFLRLTGDGPLTDLTAAYYFTKEGVLQALLHQLKYQGMTRVGEVLGRQLGALIAARREEDTLRPTLIPVPLHRAKQRERGCNQSEWICRGISAATGLAIDRSILRRIRYTRSQTGLGIGERRENVGGAFGISPGRTGDVRGGSFLLVDDVVTTGATLEACAQVLRAGGAQEVTAAAIALAL
jgi:ComF family protein